MTEGPSVRSVDLRRTGHVARTVHEVPPEAEQFLTPEELSALRAWRALGPRRQWSRKWPPEQRRRVRALLRRALERLEQPIAAELARGGRVGLTTREHHVARLKVFRGLSLRQIARETGATRWAVRKAWSAAERILLHRMAARDLEAQATRDAQAPSSTSSRPESLRRSTS